MINISKFTLHADQNILEVELINTLPEQSSKLSLPYEYLRVFSPTECQKALVNNQEVPPVFHKKNVQLSHIEPLGKHGYRFIFNDGFNDIYCVEHLCTLSKSFDTNWPSYLNTLTTANSREESINFKAVT